MTTPPLRVAAWLLAAAVVAVLLLPRADPPGGAVHPATDPVAPESAATAPTTRHEAGPATSRPEPALPATGPREPGAADLATPLPPDLFRQAAAAGEIRLQVSDGTIIPLRVTARVPGADGIPRTIEGTVAHPAPGRFIFHRQPAGTLPGPLAGAIFFPTLDFGYRVESPHGRPLLVRRPVDAVACVGYAPPPSAGEVEEIPADHPAGIPIPEYQNGVVPLQSLPGAIGVLYLDFDGEDGPHQGWGDFDAASHGTSNAGIRHVWERVAEDFAPFNLNVTTDLQVYLDAPETSRQRCIVTPTTEAAPGAGGVAFVGSFNWAGDTPCWAFYGAGKNSAEVISHELGHTLSLSHDGRTSPAETYYNGHGSGETGWAPIMGTAYSRSLSQWSKGEYLNANQSQDDLARIVTNNNDADYRPDDHGGDHAGASPLGFVPGGAVDDEGVIEQEIDVDAFRFTVQAAGSLDLAINPVAAGPNLDILAELYDAAGTQLDSDNPSGGLAATLTTAVTPGEYTVRVSGTGKGNPLDTGYTDYASLGYFTVTGTVPDPVLPEFFAVTENARAGAVVGTVAPRGVHGGNPLTWAITGGNPSAVFAIDAPTGEITVANPTVLDFEALSTGWPDPPVVELEVTINDTVDPLLDEIIRVLVTVEDVNERPSLTGGAVTILEHTAVGRPLFQLVGSDPDAFDVLRYSIVAGDPAGRFAIDANGVLSAAVDLSFADQSSYSLTVRARDAEFGGLTVDATVDVTLLDTVEGYTPGSVEHAFYRNVAGSRLSNLLSDPDFPECPDDVDLRFEIHSNGDGDNYGRVVRCYLVPPLTGDYSFWIAGDDDCELRLSTNESPFLATAIAGFTGYTDYQEWTKVSGQESAAIPLVAGQAYYLEARHKEGGGGDHLSIAWEVRDRGNNVLRAQEPVPGLFLAPYAFNYCPRLTSASASVRDNALPGTVLQAFTVDDLNPGDSHTFEILFGNTSGAFAIDPSTGTVTVEDPSALGSSHNLTVQVTDDGFPPESNIASLSVTVVPAATVTAPGPLLEFWDGISGNNLSTLTSHPDFPDRPHRLAELTTLDTGTNRGNTYGARIRGYLTPAVSGTYTFHLASDDQGELLLSNDADPANAARRIFQSNWTGYQQWDKFPAEQTSGPITLTAGEPYFIEARVKEGGGGDHLTIGWTGPGIATITVLDPSLITPYDSNVAPAFSSPNPVFDLPAAPATGATAGTVTATDSPFETITFAIIDGNDGGAFAIDPQSGEVTVADAAVLHSGPYQLVIAAQDSGHGGYFPLRTATTVATVHLGDSDHDLLPNAWELTEIGNLDADGADDSDLDGSSNRAELVFGTRPGDPGSRPAAPQPNGVQTATSCQFTLRVRNDLAPGAWQLYHSDDMQAWDLLPDTDFTILSTTPLDADHDELLIDVFRTGPRCFLKGGAEP